MVDLDELDKYWSSEHRDAVVRELRAARELAERFRFVLNGGPAIVGRGGELDELLEKYEAARDGR